MTWVIILHIFLLGLGGWLFVRKYQNTNWLWIGMGAFSIKIVALYFFVWIHQNYYAHYQPDYQLIFNDAKHLADVFYKNPQEYLEIWLDKPSNSDYWHLSTQTRAFFTVKLFSFFTIITFKNFWITAIYSSLLALWGMWQLVHTLTQFFPKTKKAAIVAFLLVPSCVFWASATSKESILLFLIGTIISVFLNIIHFEKKLKYILYKGIVSLLFCIVLWKIKYYYAFGLSISLILYGGLTYIQKYTLKKWQIAGIFILFVSMGIALSFLHPNIKFRALPEALHNNHILTIQASPERSVIELQFEPTWFSIMQKSPKALYLGLFSPMPWDSQNWQMMLVSFENVLLMVLLFLVLWQIFQKRKELPLSSNFVMMLFVYITIMAVFLAFSSPNFGALSRYRCGFSPFLWYILLGRFLKS